MNDAENIKFFCINNLSIESAVRKIEAEFDLDLGHSAEEFQENRDLNPYFMQFEKKFREESDKMAPIYRIFYCLENSIREIIIQRLEGVHGVDWWSSSVPEKIRLNAEQNFAKERATGITPRSTNIIDYANFGELGEIIKTNWSIFGDMLRDQRAVERIMSTLNTIRAPIAHCKILAEDEVIRLNLAVKDWFRQIS